MCYHIIVERYQQNKTKKGTNIVRKSITALCVITTLQLGSSIANAQTVNEYLPNVGISVNMENCEKQAIQDVQNAPTYHVPNYSGFKSFESYKLFRKDSKQYKVQCLASTDSKGLRTLDNRFCVAVGSAFNLEIGQWYDLVLANGTIIPCILADQKADQDTDATNKITVHSDCASEFVVDIKSLDLKIAQMGDVSYYDDTWNSPVVKVIVYPFNSLN
jgi:hypothetical protein